MDFWRFLGYAQTTFHHHQLPVSFERSDGEKTDLLAIARSVSPPCRLNPLLFNGHLQTIWTVVKSQDIPIYYKRRLFEADDLAFAGTFEVDFVVPEYEDTADNSLPPRTSFFEPSELENLGTSDDTPMLGMSSRSCHPPAEMLTLKMTTVILHGLSGGSHEIYLRHVLLPIVTAGWEACVVNSRGCAKSKVTSGVLYNARATWDIRQVIKWLRKTFPNRPLFGLGFSLGANILVNVRTFAGSRILLVL